MIDVLNASFAELHRETAFVTNVTFVQAWDTDQPTRFYILVASLAKAVIQAQPTSI